MENEIKKHISLSLRDSIDTERNITYLCMHRLGISRRSEDQKLQAVMRKKAFSLARGEKAAPCQRALNAQSEHKSKLHHIHLSMNPKHSFTLPD